MRPEEEAALERRRIQAEERAWQLRRTLCLCPRPLLDRLYFGWPCCRLCSKLVGPRGRTRTP